MHDPRKAREAKNHDADRRASRIVGVASTALGLLLIIPSLVLLIDRVIHFEVLACSLLFGVPALLFGLRELFSRA